jgi:hypothetical protein
MEKKELANILSEILIPIGFKRKGNYWVINGSEITKMVNLQKSQFGNYFYINYGYILNAIPSNGLMMHICKRVASLDKDENLRIDELLDLESNISNEDRIQEVKRLLVEKLVEDINLVNTEEDLLDELKKRPHLNDIPLVVKKYFNLSE